MLPFGLKVSRYPVTPHLQTGIMRQPIAALPTVSTMVSGQCRRWLKSACFELLWGYYVACRI